MNVLAVALADESQRFIRGYPPKGARLFLQPNVEVMRLASLLQSGDCLRYIDERVEPAELTDYDLCLVHIGLSLGDRARELLRSWACPERRAEDGGRRREEGRVEWAGRGSTRVFFGPQVAAWCGAAPEWCSPRVVGDITEVWTRLRKDMEAGQPEPLYFASGRPGYVSPRPVRLNQEMDSDRQTIQFVRGCFCPEPVKPLCPEYLYYGANTLLRPPEEVVGEVVSLPRKRIHLLDDDVAALPDYYRELFSRLRDHRRQWVVNASDRLFDHPRLIRLLSKAGTKAVYLNESFLLGRLYRAAGDQRLVRWLYRRVKTLQASKMLVGARLVLPAQPGTPTDYDKLASVLRQIDLDFIEPRFLQGDGSLARVVYRPMVTAAEPAWLKNYFYSMEAIADRLVRRPRRVGFFTTAVYLLPYSAAYRQSFLEGLPWP